MTDGASRRAWFVAKLESASPDALLERLCALAVEEVPVDGAVIGLQSGGVPEGPLASSSTWAREVATAEYALGEGPSFHVVRTNEHVEASNWSAIEFQRWPQYSLIAREMGVAAVFCFPLRIGRARLGAMSFLRTEPNELDDHQYLDCLALADLATYAIVYIQAGLPDSQLEALLYDRDSDRLRVHQATGMIAGAFDCSIEDALARMRAKAFVEGVTLYELSSRIITGEVRFEGEEWA
ncbi:MAG: hypothetical protein RL347_634 [Actinomycetota bacterium]|jgi:hypothetical protein